MIGIPEKVLGVLMLLLLAVMLFPIIRLAFFAAPWYDDYSFAVHVKRFIQEYGVLKGAWEGALYVVHTWWYCWQGTFSSIFMMTLMPEVFGEGLYGIGIIGIVLFFTVASLVFVKSVCKEMLKAETGMQISVAVLVTLSLVELIYTAQQGIFWYNAAVHYTFMHGCLFLLLTLVLKVFYGRTKAGVALAAMFSILLAVICGGSNFVTALQGALLMLLVTVIGFLFASRKGLWLLPADVAYGIALYFNVSAPGNSVRGSLFEGCDAFTSILYSFKAGAEYFWTFTGIITIILLVAFVLMIWNSVRKLEFDFRYPGVVSVLSFCFYCTGFTPSYYGMGSEGVSRTLVVVKFTLQLLVFFNTAYWLGWWMKHRRKNGKEVPAVKQWLPVYVLVGAAAVLWLALSSNQAGSCSTYGAYYYVHSGEAYNSYAEHEQRVETIKNSGPVVELEPCVWKPHFLYRGDLSTDPAAEQNSALATWYGKEAIYIKE